MKQVMLRSPVCLPAGVVVLACIFSIESCITQLQVCHQKTICNLKASILLSTNKLIQRQTLAEIFSVLETLQVSNASLTILKMN